MNCQGILCNIGAPCPNKAQENGLCAPCEKETVAAMHRVLRQHGQTKLAGQLQIAYHFRKGSE